MNLIPSFPASSVKVHIYFSNTQPSLWNKRPFLLFVFCFLQVYQPCLWYVRVDSSYKLHMVRVNVGYKWIYHKLFNLSEAYETLIFLLYKSAKVERTLRF